jgi:hypothetical protein
MKKALVLIILIGSFLSCKKKTPEEPEPPATTTGTPNLGDPQISVKVNDTVYTCPSLSCVSAYKSGGIRGISIGDQSAKKQLFRFTFLTMPQAGTYSIGSGNDPSFQYVRDNTYYNVTSGSLTITKVDTTDRGVIDKFEATFMAKTDTTLSASYPIYKLTEGKIIIK